MNRIFAGLAATVLAAGVVAAIVYPGKAPTATPIALSCEVRVTDADMNKARDAGVIAPKIARARGSRYSSVIIGAYRNPDGGIVYPTNLDFGEILDPAAACQVVTAANPGEKMASGTLRCACRPAAGVCRYTDGGTPPFGVTLAPNSFAGAGCIPKPCGPERAGEQGETWPDGCPER